MKPSTPFLVCLTAISALIVTLSAATSAQAKDQKLNVLFIAVDDLRPEIGAYGAAPIKTPNMDRLAASGMLFDRAYCQQAICMASRASLLSGYRPNRGEMFRCGALFEHVPDALTINQHFLNNGYQTVGIGKIYHHHSDTKQGWSKKYYFPEGDWTGRGYVTTAAKKMVQEYTRNHPNSKRKGLGPAYESADVPDSAYADGVVAERAIQELNRLKAEPFFLAVGFAKPHLPFCAPKKYWDLYDPNDIQLASNPRAPRNSPKIAWTGWGELRGYIGMPKKGPMPDQLARELIHGYYASTSYADAMIGKVLDELDRLDLTDKTVVVLWGDHGWKLGDHGMWCKHTNFELDTRVPLIVRAPGMKAAGKKTRALTELVDLYPSLVDLCGLDAPKHLQGTSFAPLLDQPRQTWKTAAFSQYPRGRARSTMGYSMRTDRYRYTEWRNNQSGKVIARELYDHQTDPAENNNLAGQAKQQQLVKKLSTKLRGQ
ncbi:MAG: sulfatase, partial [Verrucomicrobiae bacterium]|nr:sulfatase [Verrucomicrobiae bacterium]NNJ86257.1 sulfatase [Akkermansiaceae bacterium]